MEGVPSEESELSRAGKRGRARRLISGQLRTGTESQSPSWTIQPKPAHSTAEKAVSRPPRHMQASYWLTVVQAPGTPDDNVLNLASLRWGWWGRGGLELV